MKGLITALEFGSLITDVNLLWIVSSRRAGLLTSRRVASPRVEARLVSEILTLATGNGGEACPVPAVAAADLPGVGSRAAPGTTECAMSMSSCGGSAGPTEGAKITASPEVSWEEDSTHIVHNIVPVGTGW